MSCEDVRSGLKDMKSYGGWMILFRVQDGSHDQALP